MWQWVHAERAALVDDLSSIAPERWDTPSLCAGWSVHDVAAHLVSNADFRWRDLAGGLLRARFDFDRMNQLDMEKRRGERSSETLDALRAQVTSVRRPPVALASRVVEEVVHGEDIRRPLGERREYPVMAVEAALRYQLATPDSVGGCKDRLGAVRLEASDSGFTHGAGPVVSGPVLELLLLAAGRTDAVVGVSGLDELRLGWSGDAR